MRKNILFFVLLLLSVEFYAQCPISVGITSLPDVSTPVCKGTSVLLTANQSAGAVAPIYYWIIDGDTILGVDSTITILANNQTVNLIMSTSTGCSPDSAFANIQILTVLIQPTTTILNSSCDLTNADIQITSSGGASPYNYDLVGIGTSATGFYNNVPTGTYSVYITDNQGCNDTGQVIVTPEPTVIESTPTPIIEECNQTSADVVITSTGGTAPYSYDLVGIGPSTDGSYTDVPEGSYTLYTTDADGCTDTNQVTITPYICPPPVPTEVITPNEDGFNDMWLIYNIQFYPDNEVFIFDRWGQRVYHKNGYDNADGWDAKYIGVGLPVSTYYYVLKIKSKNSEDQVFKGPISVFR